MNPSEFPEHVSAQHGLAYELGNEMKALETTAHPLAHRFLLHPLTRKMAQVARSACSSLPEPVACAPALFGAHQSQRIRAILRGIGWHFHPRKEKSMPLLKYQHQGKNRCCQQCGKPLCLQCQGCSNRDCHAQTVLYCLCVLVKPRADEELRGDSTVSGRTLEE